VGQVFDFGAEVACQSSPHWDEPSGGGCRWPRNGQGFSGRRAGSRSVDHITETSSVERGIVSPPPLGSVCHPMMCQLRTDVFLDDFAPRLTDAVYVVISAKCSRENGANEILESSFDTLGDLGRGRLWSRADKKLAHSLLQVVLKYAHTVGLGCLLERHQPLRCRRRCALPEYAERPVQFVSRTAVIGRIDGLEHAHRICTFRELDHAIVRPMQVDFNSARWPPPPSSPRWGDD
jgi:hypothetical protein